VSDSVYDFTADCLLLFFRGLVVAWALVVAWIVMQLTAPGIKRFAAWAREAFAVFRLHREMDRWAREREREVWR
jgi:hypothetical protein